MDNIAEGDGTGDASTGMPSLTGVMMTAGVDGGDATGASDGGGMDEPGDGSGGQPVAQIVLDVAPRLEFDTTPALGNTDRLVVVSNTGSARAEQLDVVGLAAPFSFAGEGVYPGKGGTCGTELDAGQTCTLHFAWAPATWGEQQSSIALHYDDGVEDASTELELYGKAEGKTRNLLSNASFEDNPSDGMAPPPMWDEQSGDWRREDAAGCGGNGVPDGSFCVSAGLSGSGHAVHLLQQTIDVSAWAEFVANKEVRLEYFGYWRCQDGNDIQQVTIEFLGAGADVAEVGPQSMFDWEQADKSIAIPPNTSELRVELQCEKQGGNSCDCMFDQQQLFASYPDPI